MIERFLRIVRRRFGAWRALAQARATTERRLSSGPVRRVLVVCYGNIYRSPFVGEYLRLHGPAELEVRTRGFHRVADRPSPERHVEMSVQFGIDLSAHRSAIVTADDLEWADTVILMDRHNWAALVEAGVAREKLLWIGALSGDGVEIPDPYTLETSAAERVLESLHRACENLISRWQPPSAAPAEAVANEAVPGRTP